MKFLKVIGNKILHSLPSVLDFPTDVRSKWMPEDSSDANFVISLGRPAQENDRYWNSSSKVVREYSGGSFRDIKSGNTAKVIESPVTVTISGGGSSLNDYLATQQGNIFLADLTINLDAGNYTATVIKQLTFRNGAKLKIVGNDIQGSGRTFVKGAFCNPGVFDSSYGGLNPYYTISVNYPTGNTISVSVVDGVLPFDSSTFVGNKVLCESKIGGSVERTIVAGSAGGTIILDSALPAGHFTTNSDSLTLLPNRKVSEISVYDFEGILFLSGIHVSFAFRVLDYDTYNNGTYEESRHYNTKADVRFSRCAVLMLRGLSVFSSFRTEWNDDYQTALSSSFYGNHNISYGRHEFFWSFFGSTISIGVDTASPGVFSKACSYAFFRKCNFVGRYSWAVWVADNAVIKMSLCTLHRQNGSYVGSCGIIESRNDGKAIIHLCEFKLIGTKIAQDFGIWALDGGKITRSVGTIVSDLTNSFENFGTACRAEDGGTIIGSTKDSFTGNTTNRSPTASAVFGNNGGLTIIVSE